MSKSNKRRKRECSCSSSATVVTAFGLVVVSVPTGPGVKIRPFNALRGNAVFEANCPKGVSAIRLNHSLNLLAVDTGSGETTSTLLKISKLLGVNVRAYSPRTFIMTIGVIHGATFEIIEEHLLGALHA